MENIPGTVLTFVFVAYSIILHEIAHGYSAKLFGDPTAERLGRLTMNPIDHIDPVGTILLPLIQLAVPPHRIYLAWAKPVPVNTSNLLPRVPGEIIVAMAGIFVNLSIALAMAIVLGFKSITPEHSQLQFAVFYSMIANVGLAVFNLVPIPPLDGHHVMKYLLPENLRGPYARMGMNGIVVILMLNMSGVLSNIIGPPIGWIIDLLLDHVTTPIRGHL